MTGPHDPSTSSDRALSKSPAMAEVWQVLETVMDPEIPVLSVVDLGIIADVRSEGEDVVVDLMPTFAGCPAIDMMREQIREAVSRKLNLPAAVRVVYDPPWTSDRITEEGRRKLREFGLAPPEKACGGPSLPRIESVSCPYCASANTTLESLFGPTLCRSIHYCNGCRQSFEHFKPV